MVGQPYAYRRVELAEPGWRRFPGWADVSAADWESAQWQRAHCVKNIRQLRSAAGDGLEQPFYADLDRDQRERATMSMLVPPQMLNTIASAVAPGQLGFIDAFYADPVRRLHDPGVFRSPRRLAIAPVRAAGLAARGGNVGGGGHAASLMGLPGRLTGVGRRSRPWRVPRDSRYAAGGKPAGAAPAGRGMGTSAAPCRRSPTVPSVASSPTAGQCPAP